MAASTFVKTFLAGCLLYLCVTFGEASLAKVTSLTSAVVEHSVSAHVNRDVFGHGRQARFKREVASKTLEDPKQCLSQCRDNETSQLTKAILRNTARLIALALEDIKGGETDIPEKEAAFKKQIEEKTIANMGPLFEDMCKVHKSSGLCFSKCPDSQARSILTIDNQGTQDAVCEPTRNWNSFPEYWAALNCTNSTEEEKPCEKKCGPDESIRNATKLEIVDPIGFADDDEEGGEKASKSSSNDGITVKYETDTKKNTASANRVCRLVSCQLDCYKPVMTKECGAKAYDLYSRMSKVEPHETLGMLKVLKAVDQPDDCKPFA